MTVSEAGSRLRRGSSSLAYQWKATLVLGSGRAARRRARHLREAEAAPTPCSWLSGKRAGRQACKKATEWIRAAVEAARVAFLSESAAKGDSELLSLSAPW